MSLAVSANEDARVARLPSVIIVGAGFGGIAAAIELKRAGIDDVRILERAADLGGTWYYNSYPGCACDVPSHLYSFSFAQRRDWSRLCSPQTEIHGYLHEVARAHGVEALVQPGCDVTACEWDEPSCTWTVSTAQGESFQADAIVLATGQLHQPSYPRIERAEEFAGHSFHSAVWDHAYDLAGKRVLFSSQYLPALQRANVELITDAIARLDPSAIVTSSGARLELDCIIWATGFRTTQFMFPMQITTSTGRDLRDAWAEGAHAHFGITVPGFPNMFVLYGPNTNTSGGSIIAYHEAQASYLRQALEQVRDRGAGAIDVRPEVEA